MKRRSRVHITVERTIDTAAERVWELITDTHHWPLWGPSITRVISEQRHIALRTRGRVKTSVGIWLPFVVTEFTASRYWRWQVAGIHATGHAVESLGPNRCRLIFSVPLWAGPYIIVCKAALNRIQKLAAKPLR